MWILLASTILLVSVGVVLFLRKMNTFAVIARNMTYIYEILHDEYKERFSEEDALLMTCGIIDTLSYDFPLEDMKLALLRAQDGNFSSDNLAYNEINKREVLLMLKRRSNLFVKFVLEVEIMIFLQDTSHHRQDILTAVVSMTEKIEKAIASAKRSYASGRRPPLWHRAVTNFMNADTFERARNELGIIPPAHGAQLDELFQELVEREHWKAIDPDIIKSIFKNAKGDLGRIKTFIRVSELHNSVGNNFVEHANNASKEYALQLFALTLYRLGSELFKAAFSAKTDEEATSLWMRADMAFTSSILCNPFCLESYFSMALLYSGINKDVSLEWCAKYKEAEDKLLNTPNGELNTFQLSRKKNVDPKEAEKAYRMMAEHSPHLLPDDDIEFDGETMRDKINELEAELVQAVTN